MRPRSAPTLREWPCCGLRRPNMATISTMASWPASGAVAASSAPGCWEIRAAYARDPSLTNLLLVPTLEVRSRAAGGAAHGGATAVGLGIPVLAMSASLAYFDAYRTARLPANMTQAQRDYFGAHTYRRIDKEGSFHTEWEA